MPLKLLDFQTKGQVATLNRWADTIESSLSTMDSKILFNQNNPILPKTLQQTAYQQGNHGPIWTSGEGTPTGTPAVGSFYSNTTGTSGSSLYVFNGAAWVAIA